MSRPANTLKDSRRELLTWLIILAALTLASVGWLISENVDVSSDFSPAIIVIAYSSSLAAIIAATLTGGVRSVKALFPQIGRWRVAPKLYAIALLLPVGIATTAYLGYRFAGGEVSSPFVDLAALTPGLAAIIAGGLGEELGWRGFAQPRLQRKFSVFWASVIIGIIWASWHSWPLLMHGGLEGPWVLDTALTYLRLVSTAVIYGWLYQASGSSLLLVILAHMAHNVVLTSIVTPVGDTTFTVLIAVLYALTASIVTYCARTRIFAKV